MGLPSISDIVARFDAFLKNKFAAVIAGWDGSRIVRVLRTDATGRLLVDASVSFQESPQVEIVNIENGAVGAGLTTVLTEFIISQPIIPPPPATRRFTIGMTLGVGNGNIIIEGRGSAGGAWQTLYSMPIAAGGMADLSYIPSWPRYRVYYKATIASTGVYFQVMTHPMV